MEVTKATENEIVNLISKHINSNFECIVSNEELGNQEWNDISNWGHGNGIINYSEGYNDEHDRDGLIEKEQKT